MLSGYWADRAQRKIHAMVSTRLVQAGLFLLIACLIGKSSSLIIFFTLLLINFICDLLGQYSNGIVLPLLKHLLPASDMKNALSLTTAGTEVIKLVCQGAGAGLIVLLHHHYALFAVINAVTFLLAACLVIQQRHLIAPPEKKPAKLSARPTRRPFLHESWNSIRQLHHQTALFPLLLLFFFVNAVDSSSDALVSLTLVGSPSFWIGNFGNTVATCNMLFSAGLILGALLNHDWLKNCKLTSLLNITLIASLTISLNFIFQGTVWLLFAAMFVLAYALGKIGPRFSALMIERTDERRLAATAGAVNTLLLLGAPLGQSIFMTLANVSGIRICWMLYSALAALLIIFSLFTKHKLKIQRENHMLSK